MARDDKKPTTPSVSALRQSIIAAARALRRMPRPSPEEREALMRVVAEQATAVRAAQKLIPPETLEALAEIGRAIREDAISEDGAASTSTPAPPTSPTPETPALAPAAPVSEPPRRAGHGPQTDRVRRVLSKAYPPDGKPPRGTTGKAVRDEIIRQLAIERENGRAPENEKGLRDPSPNVVYSAIKNSGS